MDDRQRFELLLQAPKDVLAEIDDILEGKRLVPQPGDLVNCRLLKVGEACKMLGISYPTFYRAMRADCFDVIKATGGTLISERSVIEFSQGKRKPSEKSTTERAERARKMREEYHENKAHGPACA